MEEVPFEIADAVQAWLSNLGLLEFQSFFRDELEIINMSDLKILKKCDTIKKLESFFVGSGYL